MPGLVKFECSLLIPACSLYRADQIQIISSKDAIKTGNIEKSVKPFMVEALIETRLSNWRANQWTGFYMIGTSIMTVENFNAHHSEVRPGLIELVRTTVTLKTSIL